MSKRDQSAPDLEQDAYYDEEWEPSTLARLSWLVAAIVWVLLLLSMVSYSPLDTPSHVSASGQHQVSNWIGPVGAATAHELFSMVGSGAWILVLAAGGYLLYVAYWGIVEFFAVRAIGVIMIALAFSGFHALVLPEFTSLPEGAGGMVGIAGVNALESRFGALGSAVWLVLLAVIGATVAYDRILIAAPALAMHGLSAGVTRLTGAIAGGTERLRTRRAEARANDVDDDHRLKTNEALARTAAESRKRRRKKLTVDENVGGIGAGEDFDEADDPVSSDEAPDTYEEEAWDDEEEALPGAPQVFDPEALREKISKLPVRFAGTQKRSATNEDLDLLRAQRRSEEEADRNYIFPDLDLLENPELNYTQEMESLVREQAEALEQALKTYRIDGEVVSIDSGPVITLFQVRLAPGTKVSSIQTVASDIARSLKAVNLRVVPNTEGLDTVGIEVPNRKKEKVRLKELMTSSDLTSKMKLPLFLGKDASGNPLIVDLAALPHALIAGTTGSGKSVCMNAIIMGFLYTQKPSDLKLVLVDPKMVELSQFKDIPHLMCPVVTEMNKAAAILEWAVTKMDERYELLAEAGCRDISAYNGLEWEELKERLNPTNELEEAKIPRKLPYMVFVIDELADLMMTNKEVESSIVRIAQKARAVGIHLILATQRPQANVVTGLIKSNMPGRIAFKVASGMDSRIVLDQKGGELLLGQGDMLMLTPRSSTAIRAQGTLVDDREIRRVVRFVRDVSAPNFERQLVQLRSGGFGADDHEQRMRESAQEDPLFDRAVEIVLETRRGSVSLLQRRLAIGYTRASRLIELMGQAGIIGEHKGSVAREVMMSIDEWNALKAQAEADAQRGDENQQILFSSTRIESGARDGEQTAHPRLAIDIEDAPFDIDEPEDLAEDFETETADDEVNAAEPEDIDHDASESDDEVTEDDDEPLAAVAAIDGDADDDEEEEVDPEAEYEEDADDEYEYVDDDDEELEEESEEYEYEYVDEEGNPIDPSEIDEDEFEIVDEESEEDGAEEEAPEIATRPMKRRESAA